MLKEMNSNEFFCKYYEQWIGIYKEGAIRKVTLDKYKMTIKGLRSLYQMLSFVI